MLPIGITVLSQTPVNRAQYWRGPAWRALIAACAEDMGDAARANILKYGGPGGAWPKLSGFGQGRSRRRVLHKRANKLLAGKMEATEDSDFVNERTLERRASDDYVQGNASPHDGYARRKHLGKTPGAGKFGPDVRLRDTGGLFASLRGRINWTGNGAVIRLVADGVHPSGTPYQVILQAHRDGAGNLPQRDPMADDRLYKRRNADRIRQFLEFAPK